MKTLPIMLALLILTVANAAALEACNRYDDNVDECYENYYRDASNYNYDRHRSCEKIDGYQSCAGGAEPKAVVRWPRGNVLRNHCWYDRYTGRLVCEHRYRD